MNIRRVIRVVRCLVPVLCGGALVLLAGCTVGPDYEEPDYEMPDAWQNAAAADVEGEAPVIENWWSALGDARLDSLIVRARRANPDLSAAIARIREARAYHQIAGGDYYPQVGFNGTFTRTEIGENTALGGVAALGDNSQATGDLIQTGAARLNSFSCSQTANPQAPNRPARPWTGRLRVTPLLQFDKGALQAVFCKQPMNGP